MMFARGAGAQGVRTAGAMAIMSLTALMSSYLLPGEAFRWVHLAGFGLVFAGLVLMILEHASRSTRNEEA